MRFVATTPAGFSDLLAAELKSFGATACNEGPAHVAFSAPLAVAYRALLWSRVASRILLPLAEFEVNDPDDVYAAARAVPWHEHMDVRESFAVHAATHGGVLTHSRYAALRVKDAVCDHFRDRSGERPLVDTAEPGLRLYLHVERQAASLGIDLAGEGLHRRGYRDRSGPAPVKENLAAALLLRCGWREGSHPAFVDLMCGTGTFLIEAACIALDHAPGLLRDRWGHAGWLAHDRALWRELTEEARSRAASGRGRDLALLGRDHDPRAIEATRLNLQAAGLLARTRLERADITQPCTVPTATGLVFANPPYGERLGEAGEVEALYRALGERLKADFNGWQAGVLLAGPGLGHALGLRARRVNRFHNGDLDCQLLRIDVDPRWYREVRGELGADRGGVTGRGRGVPDAAGDPAQQGQTELTPAPVELTAGARMFANRIARNLKQLGAWAAQAGVDCWRLYDADMPEYAVAVDLYHGERRWAVVQEYAAPPSVDPARAAARLAEVMTALPGALAVPARAVFLKRRERQRGEAQYSRLARHDEYHVVQEGPARLAVNFTDYLDTGLFLDHRITRARVAALARGRHFLNLYAYTGVATVQAALAGALTTTSVDLSARYLDWIERNLHLNGLGGPAHRLVEADCLEWLTSEAQGRRRWGVIFLDPPTFSNSRRMQGTLDVQRDHVTLIERAMQLLEPNGVLVFSNNFRRFRLDAAALHGYGIEDISAATIPPDFQRNPRIHRCWEIRWPEGAARSDRPVPRARR